MNLLIDYTMMRFFFFINIIFCFSSLFETVKMHRFSSTVFFLVGN